MVFAGLKKPQERAGGILCIVIFFVHCTLPYRFNSSSERSHKVDENSGVIFRRTILFV